MERMIRLVNVHCFAVNQTVHVITAVFKSSINPLALELDIYSLAHHLCKV